MSTRPTVWNRVLAKMSGEVPADALEAYKRASLLVYEALERSEAHRREAKENNQNAWAIKRAAQAEMLCTWNAFALQNLGDAILQANYELDPLTVGFVPPETSEQILRFYSPIEGWLSRAGQARLNPEYRIDVSIPSPLPPWSEARPTPEAHARGMISAMRILRDHAEADLIFLNAVPPVTSEQQRQLNAIRAQHAAVLLKVRYADDMMGVNSSREVQERVEGHIKEALSNLYQLGQVLAMPWLASATAPAAAPSAAPTHFPRPAPAPPAPVPPPTPRPAPIPAPVRPAPTPAPVAPPKPVWSFDIWCMTDPEARPKLERDPQARLALETLWKRDPDPDRTLSIQTRIDNARASGTIAFATDVWGVKLDHYFACPWQPAYTVRRPISINGQKLSRGQQFIFNVSAPAQDGPFEREILVGSFSETESFEYRSSSPTKNS